MEETKSKASFDEKDTEERQTGKTKISLAKAKEIAFQAIEILEPFCERISIAGSVRRNKPFVGDYEIVCVPLVEKTEQTALFGSQQYRYVQGFVDAVRSIDGKIVLGNPADGRYVKIQNDLISCDLFIVTKETWGNQLFIRTGPADWNKMCIALLKKRGYFMDGGKMYKDGKFYPVYEESEMFELLGSRHVKPEERR